MHLFLQTSKCFPDRLSADSRFIKSIKSRVRYSCKPLSVKLTELNETVTRLVTKVQQRKGTVIRSSLHTDYILYNYYYYYCNNSRTSLIRTPKGQSKVSVLERCPLYRGHEYYVTLKAPLMVLSVL